MCQMKIIAVCFLLLACHEVLGAEEKSDVSRAAWDEWVLESNRLQVRLDAGLFYRTGLSPLNVDWFTQHLEDADVKVRIAAVKALGVVGPDAKTAVGALVKLAENDAGCRLACYSTFDKLGSAASAAVPALVAALETDTEHRSWIAHVLGSIGPDAKAAVPALVECLRDDRKQTRRGAAAALGEIGPAASAAVPGLTVALDDRFETVRVYAAIALWSIEKCPKSLSVLIDAMGAEERDDRIAAILGIGDMGVEAQEAVAALKAARKRCVQEPDRSALPAISWALGRLRGHKGVAQDVAVWLKDNDPLVRTTAVTTLQRLGTDAKVVLCDIEVAIDDEHELVRFCAAGALWEIDRERFISLVKNPR